MARSVRRSMSSTKPLVKAPTRIGHLDATSIVGALRHLHEEAEDATVDRMPADEELYGALLYLESRVGSLKTVEARRIAAMERIRLWEYLREQADVHQAKAIADARAAQAQWADLASVLAVNAPSAAYNKALRLKAATLSNPSDSERPVRRTPEAVLLAERQAAAKASAQRQAEEAAARRHTLMVPVAQRLLEHRAELDDDDDVTFWLDQVEAVLPHCETPTQFVSLGIYVEAAVRELRKAEPRVGEDALSVSAQHAIAAASALVT